jgi:vitamin B12 transporter
MGGCLARYLAACAAVILLASSAKAQNQTAGDPVVLPTIVVSATGLPTPASEVANSVTVITAAEIQRQQYRSVPDILNDVPGLNVVQSGGPGGQTSVFIRGAGSQHVKVLIDGIDVGDPSTPNGAFDFGNLMASDIARIEILRGPQSGLYGSNAIGGVISITTKKGSGPARATAALEGGSMGTFSQTVSLSGSKQRFDYAFNVAHYRATGIPVTPSYMLLPGEKANPNSYDNWTYSTRLGAQVTDDLKINFYGHYIDSNLLYTNDTYNLTTFSYVANPTRSDYATQDAFGRLEAVWSALDGRFVNTFGVDGVDYRRTNQDPGTPESKYDGTRVKFDWRGNLLLMPGEHLVMGLEREDERADSNASSSGTLFSYSAKTGNQAAYAELQSQIDDRYFLVANIRDDDNDQFGQHATWRVAPAVLLPGIGTKLKASYGTGFKAPTLYELYGVGDYGYVGNPNLKPETSSGYDVGFEQPLAGGRVKIGATYFHNDITNLINGVFLPVNTYVNVGEAVMQGVEAFAQAQVTDAWRVRVDYTYTDAKDAVTGDELLRRPRNKVSVSSVWKPTDKLTLSSTLLYVGSWKDYDRQGLLYAPEDAPAYTVVNLAAEYRMNKNVTWFGRIDNLFDRRYEDPIGWQQPGLTIYGGVRIATN